MQHELSSVARAMQILDALAEAGPMGTTELSRHLGLHKSIVSKYLATLKSGGFVAQIQHGRYELGLHNFEISQRMLQRAPFRRAITPHLERLAYDTGETAYVGVIHGTKLLYLRDCVSRQPVRLAERSGLCRPLWQDAAGKAMLAHRDPSTVFQELKSLRKTGARHLPPLAKLKTELALVRKSGYAVERETEAGLITVAAPLIKSGAPVTAALALGGPVSRLSELGVERLGRLVSERARIASIDIGWLVPDKTE